MRQFSQRAIEIINESIKEFDGSGALSLFKPLIDSKLVHVRKWIEANPKETFEIIQDIKGKIIELEKIYNAAKP